MDSFTSARTGKALVLLAISVIVFTSGNSSLLHMLAWIELFCLIVLLQIQNVPHEKSPMRMM